MEGQDEFIATFKIGPTARIPVIDEGGRERLDIHRGVMEGADGADLQLIAGFQHVSRNFIDDRRGR